MQRREISPKPWQECMMTHCIEGDIMFWSNMINLTEIHGKPFDGVKYFLDNCRFEPVRTKMFDVIAEKK